MCVCILGTVNLCKHKRSCKCVLFLYIFFSTKHMYLSSQWLKNTKFRKLSVSQKVKVGTGLIVSGSSKIRVDPWRKRNGCWVWPQCRPYPPGSRCNPTGSRHSGQSSAAVRGSTNSPRQGEGMSPESPAMSRRQCHDVGPKSIQKVRLETDMPEFRWTNEQCSNEGPRWSYSRWLSPVSAFMALTNIYSRIYEYWSYMHVNTHRPYLLQWVSSMISFPSFSSSYCTFHKIFCILLITVLCLLIVPFSHHRHMYTLLLGTAGVQKSSCSSDAVF